MNRFKEASRDCSTCLKYEPQNIKALWRRAVARKNEKRFKKAFTDIQAAINLDPENVEIQKEYRAIEHLLNESLKPRRRLVPITEFGEFPSIEKKAQSVSSWKPQMPSNAIDFERDWKTIKTDANRVAEYLEVNFPIDSIETCSL